MLKAAIQTDGSYHAFADGSSFYPIHQGMGAGIVFLTEYEEAPGITAKNVSSKKGMHPNNHGNNYAEYIAATEAIKMCPHDANLKLHIDRDDIALFIKRALENKHIFSSNTFIQSAQKDLVATVKNFPGTIQIKVCNDKDNNPDPHTRKHMNFAHIAAQEGAQENIQHDFDRAREDMMDMQSIKTPSTTLVAGAMQLTEDEFMSLLTFGEVETTEDASEQWPPKIGDADPGGWEP